MADKFNGAEDWSDFHVSLTCEGAIWDLTRKKYLDMDNAAQFFDLKTRIKEMKQGTMSVTQYNTELQNIWQELDLFYESDLGCEDCCLKQKRMIEKEHVFKFLVGLNRELDEVHGRILSRSPFPSINDVFAKVRRKEDRKQVMLGEKTTIKGWLMALPLSHTVYQRTEAMESNGNACGATIATVPGILVTLAGKFTENQQTGH